MRLADVKPLRRIVLALLKTADWDVRVRNPWAPEFTLKLNIYTHKGYWWQGRNRERKTMEAFAALVQPSQTVIEVGGHIGYIAQYFAYLVGKTGRVIVFEPGPNNLPYIEENLLVCNNVILERRAVADKTAEVDFFVENVTGQNNSLVSDYEMFAENSAAAFSSALVQKVTVPAVTLDDYVRETGCTPDFIKIDAEGAEVFILKGMQRILERYRPVIMVEVTVGAEHVFRILTEHRYMLRTFQPNAIAHQRPGNVFAFPEEKISSWHRVQNSPR